MDYHSEFKKLNEELNARALEFIEIQRRNYDHCLGNIPKEDFEALLQSKNAWEKASKKILDLLTEFSNKK